ncbi:CD276 antigen-like isoform X2 [Arapaima gigas]
MSVFKEFKLPALVTIIGLILQDQWNAVAPGNVADPDRVASLSPSAEVQVTTCIIFEDCVLPCRFQPGAANSVSWYRREVPFLSSSDQSVRHDRASLFTEKVPEGDASLLLRGSTFQDRGKYRCHVNGTAGERDSVVLLRVKAPIRFVSLEMAQSKMTQLNCSSQNIYPAPHLRWFTDPPSPPWLLRPVTRMEANGKGLYFVQSSLTVVGSLADYTYICVVNASYGTQTWRASLREKDVTGIAGQPLTIPCLAPRDLTNFTLTWTFLREQRPSTILTYSSYTGLMTNSWSDQAEVDGIQARSGNGSIRLWKLRNEENAGLYTCTFSAFQMSHTVLTRVSITAESHARPWIIAAVVVTLVLLGLALVVYAQRTGLFHSWRQMSEQQEHSGSCGTTEMEGLETAKPGQATALSNPDAGPQ